MTYLAHSPVFSKRIHRGVLLSLLLVCQELLEDGECGAAERHRILIPFPAACLRGLLLSLLLENGYFVAAEEHWVLYLFAIFLHR